MLPVSLPLHITVSLEQHVTDSCAIFCILPQVQAFPLTEKYKFYLFNVPPTISSVLRIQPFSYYFSLKFNSHMQHFHSNSSTCLLQYHCVLYSAHCAPQSLKAQTLPSAEKSPTQLTASQWISSRLV